MHLIFHHIKTEKKQTISHSCEICVGEKHIRHLNGIIFSEIDKNNVEKKLPIHHEPKQFKLKTFRIIITIFVTSSTVEYKCCILYFTHL